MCNVLEKEYLLFLFHTKNIKSASDFVTVSTTEIVNQEKKTFLVSPSFFCLEESGFFLSVIRPDLI